MTRKNAQKVAARARQAQLGGKYLAHHRQVGAGATPNDLPEDLEPSARVLDEPAYPGDDFGEHLEGEHADVVEMCRWFFCRFEDPAQGVPHDSGEGGYQYVFGGPHDATDELSNAFPDAEEEHLDRAIELIQNYGSEWVPIGLY